VQSVIRAKGPGFLVGSRVASSPTGRDKGKTVQSPLAGKPAPKEILIDPAKLVREYFERRVDASDPAGRVTFGTSGHRGSSLDGTFNEAHVLAMTQAVCEHRRAAGVDGPLFLGIDTHALSRPALGTALEVLAANGVETRIQERDGFTPTPAVSRAILAWNAGRASGLADGIVITPSHNPPRDGGFKYNPPHGGPAGGDITGPIEKRSNELLARIAEVRRMPLERARREPCVREFDFVAPYVSALGEVLDLEAVRSAGISIGVDPLGGSNLGYWSAIAERYGLRITVVNDRIDPRFDFMTVDRDGKIRMDCSSPWAMAGLVALKDRFDVAFGNDADSDRHGIVTRSSGLMNPNHYLSVAIAYLFSQRKEWRPDAAVGKTLVSSAMIDRVAAKLGRRLVEVPVGFKWFVDGLTSGEIAFGGEESAGASFVKRDGSVWTTDKDGILLGLLAAEITARWGKDPGVLYRELTEEFGEPRYERIDAAADERSRAILGKLKPEDVSERQLAGDPILERITRAPGNGASIGGLKVTTRNGWFAARPSGTENVYKIYAESFVGDEHLRRIQDEARAIVDRVIGV
jgi:phosphoglucomutase